MNNQTIELLKNGIIEQAKYFLQEVGEFYPFGLAINSKGEIVPVGVYFGEEHPDSVIVITELGKVLFNGLKSGEYEIAAMGIDIFVNDNNVNSKKESALEIRIMNNEKLLAKYIVPYIISNNEVIFRQNGKL